MNMAKKAQQQAVQALHEQANADAQQLAQAQAEGQDAEYLGDAPEAEHQGDAFHTPEPDANPAPPAASIRFKRVGTDRDKYQRGFMAFEAVGDTFTGRPLRVIFKEQDPDLEYNAIEFERYPDGAPFLLPGNHQLLEFMIAQLADKERAGLVLQITLAEIVKDKADPNKIRFKRFEIQEEERDANA